MQTSTYSFETPEEMIEVFEGRATGDVYSRYDNPTVRLAERKLASLEAGERALLFSSGIAALHSVLWTSLRSGDRLLASRDLYGGTEALIERLLPRIGAVAIRADLTDPRRGAAAIAESRPALLLFETPTNPLLRVLDGASLCAAARQNGARVVVDNTFATPVLQNPIAWGADLVVHSATKYLGGHSDLILGVVVGARRDLLDPVEAVRRSFGASPDPFAAWLLDRGLATLPLRVRAQTATAAQLAERLARHPGVRAVHYPPVPLGGVLSIDLEGGRPSATAFLAELSLFKLATSLGGVESLASHPATSSHRMLTAPQREALGIGEGLVRLAVGLEDVEDIWADLEGALDRMRAIGR